MASACTLPSHIQQARIQEQKVLEPGDHLITLTHDGRERSAWLHLPLQDSLKGPLPLVINFHASGGNALQHQEYTGFDQIADREGFAVVYPNGTGPGSSGFLTWNAGNCCGFARMNKIDDIGFIRALLTAIRHNVSIDTTRIYATGLSNGAMMTYRLAAEASDQIAAIAPVAGAMMVENISPSHPVPIMHIHSLDDPRAPYEGGKTYLIPLTHKQEYHPPVERGLKEWIVHNRCQRPPRRELITYSDKNQKGADTTQRIRYEACQTGANITLWQLNGPGHVWPGGHPTLLQRFWGPATHTIHINRVVWNFFRSHTRLQSSGE